jgi:hypothetical protein
MEALIGFAFGYWVGTRQGREGLERANRFRAGDRRAPANEGAAGGRVSRCRSG